jgi:hypothetical protein
MVLIRFGMSDARDKVMRWAARRDTQEKDIIAYRYGIIIL